jgi:membrane glycosyltransferase
MELRRTSGIIQEVMQQSTVASSSAPYHRYLDRLPMVPRVRREIVTQIEKADEATSHEEMVRAHRCLHETFAADVSVPPDNPAYASVAARMRLWYPELLDVHTSPLHLPLAPPIHRASMVPRPWGELNPFRRLAHSSTQDAFQEPAQSAPSRRWQHGGNVRRIVLLMLMLVQTVLATYFMSQVLPYHGGTPLEIGVLTLFSILFCWVSAGFWTAMTGFLILLRGTDRFVISENADHDAPIDDNARVAVVMPICNEDITRVMAGLRATYESVMRTPLQAHFDFYVLSDSDDPDICTAEVGAWADLCADLNTQVDMQATMRMKDGSRIFYRRRQRRVKRKSGNIDDFCRRWGKDYRYMVVLDADSVMSGSCLNTLLRMMEGNPDAGIIQTAPRAAGRDTLYARIQQFSSRVYGPLFTAGLHYWQLGESHYWGHNAIIRVEPFIRHCALAPLPGRGALSGEILSHDFVEAALMRRAGYGVWIAYDLEGSYEEMPPNLLDELKRDRRWCQGNLMNLRLVTARGIHAVHRAVFVTGALAYLSAPLWLAFLAFSTGMLAMHTLTEPQYFFTPRQLFPLWPQWQPEKAIGLLTATACLLFLPKLLAVLTVLVKGAKGYGGALSLFVGMLLEWLFSTLLAPVRMLFHTRFVLAAWLGLQLRWTSPPRQDSQTTWNEAIHNHGMHTLFGLAWTLGVYWLNPSFLLWLLPISGALMLSIPLSVWSSKVSLGRLARRLRLFAIPEERDPPDALKETFTFAETAPPAKNFIDAVVDPRINALLCAAMPHAVRSPCHQPQRVKIVQHALLSGPYALTKKEKNHLLSDPFALSALHLEVWSSAHAHHGWKQSSVFVS